MKRSLFIILIICFLFPINLYAAELPLTEKLLFARQLKEYACKIIFTEVKHSDPSKAVTDIKNLREIIIDKLHNSPEHLIEFKNFIIHNLLFSSAFKDLKKSLSEKIKFDSLQGNTEHNNVLPDLDLINISSDKKPRLTLSEKLLFKSSYNSSFHRPLVPLKKSYAYYISKDIQQDYSSIVADYQKITDINTLNQYGPSVVERSEKILLGNDDSLILDNVVYLIEMSGNCHIALTYGTNIPQDLKQKYFLEYINKLYTNAIIINYKYCMWYASTRIYDSMKKYDDLVDYSVKIKKDIFEKLGNDYKFSMAFIIAYCITYYCEAKERFYEIGLENSNQAVNLVELTNNPYYPTPEDKRVLKLNYRLRLTAEFYAKYKQYNEAISELDIIINSPPPTSGNAADLYKDIIANAKKRKNELLPLASYVKTDKEKIIFNTNEKLTDLKVEVIDGNNQSSSFLITAVSDNNEIAEIISAPAIIGKKNNTKIFNLKLKNFGECKIKITATSKNTSQKITLTKDIPVHGYTVYLNEACFVQNGSPYIKLKEVIKTGTDTYIDQEILSPEYKYDGSNTPSIKPVALEKNTVPNFDVKFKILYRFPISSIKARAWARAKDDEVPPVEDFVEIKPDSTDSSLFILKCKLTKDFSTNSICAKQISINYQISTIIYQNESGTQTDNNCNFANFTNEIPFYYSWKKPLEEPVYEIIAYFASNWAAGIDNDEEIVKNLYEGWTLKKPLKHNYEYGIIKSKRDDDLASLSELIAREYGECGQLAKFFKAMGYFHGIPIEKNGFKLSENLTTQPLERYSIFLVSNPGIGLNQKKNRYASYEVYKIKNNASLTYPFIYDQTNSNNNTLEFHKALPTSDLSTQCFQRNYWHFNNHVLCFYKNKMFDTSFDYPIIDVPNPGIQNKDYDLSDLSAGHDEEFKKYFIHSVTYIGGRFNTVDSQGNVIAQPDVYFLLSQLLNDPFFNQNNLWKPNLHIVNIDWTGELGK